MTTRSSDLGRRVEAALRAVLPGSVALDVDTLRSDGGEFRVKIRGRPFRVTWVANAWLSVVRGILARDERPDIVVGERVPPGSRDALSDAGIGWVDTSGSAEIDTDFLVVSRSGRIVRSEGTRGWTPAVLGVAEAILAGVKPTVSATREATGLSAGACTNALRFLTDLGLLDAEARRGRRAGRRLSRPDALLDVYVAAAHDLQPPLTLNVGITWRDPVEALIDLGDRWDEAGVEWVATGLVAATVVAPLVTSVGTAEVYVRGSTVAELELAASAVGLRPIEGGRLVLSPLPTETTHRMATTVDGLRVSAWPRLVADLRRSGVRGEEAAEHLRRSSIGG